MDIKIKLKVKDVEIELSLEELRELKEIIETLTEKKIEYVPYVRPYVPTYPYPEPWIHWDITTDSSSITDNNEYTVMCK